MRKRLIAAVAGLATIVLPAANAVAATAKTIVTTKRVTGPQAVAGPFGYVEVILVVKKTARIVGTHTTVTRKITNVLVPIFPNHTSRSIFINQQAVPLLTNEVLTMTKFNPNIEFVGGATATSYAFAQSLQAAILHAKKI